MPLETHPCKAEGCGEPCPRTHLMCVRHWRMVPAPLRREVWAEARRFKQQSMAKHAQQFLDAIARAVAAVREKEIRRELKRGEGQAGLGF